MTQISFKMDQKQFLSAIKKCNKSFISCHIYFQAEYPLLSKQQEGQEHKIKVDQCQFSQVCFFFPPSVQNSKLSYHYSLILQMCWA